MEANPIWERSLRFAGRQIQQVDRAHNHPFPMYTSGGRWHHEGEQWTDWCGGFLAGIMWLLHRHTSDPQWRDAAEHYSRLLEHRKHDRNVHDLGFIFLNTYRRWYDLAGDSALMDVVAEAGVTLAGRFQEKGQYLASFLGPHSLFIDIMMNVPLLFVAADWIESRKESDASAQASASAETERDRPANLVAAELRRKALAHCRTSKRYLVRPDGSTAHEAIFDTETGEFLRQSTQQGLRADSCWSRGQAWALYGFATVYRLTGETEFLDTACRCADYFLDHLPPGKVPYWDFDLPAESNPHWDSSAAAIAASGLLDLAVLLASPHPNPLPASGEREKASSAARHTLAASQTAPETLAARYRGAALEILDVLCGDEFLAAATPGWEGILKHAVYHIHKGLGVDESVMWGDHFFVEALIKAGSEKLECHV
jgi:unsaturated chondroitin disaccharide hydrolase